jgi:hypothetical protein
MESIEIHIGYEHNDFIKDKITIMVSQMINEKTIERQQFKINRSDLKEGLILKTIKTK